MECHVCLEAFDATERRPKALPCGHTFCLRCLQGLQAKQCPLDQKVFEPAPGELADNYMLLQLCSKPAERPAFQLWCKTCKKEALAVCADEHTTCTFKKARAEEAAPLLVELQRGQAGLKQLRQTLNSAAQRLDLASSRSELDKAEFRLGLVKEGLERAKGEDAAKWTEAKQAAVPCGLSRSASQLAAVADPSTKCKVTVQRGEADGVAWSGEVRPAESAAARLLLCQLACGEGLQQQDQPTEEQQRQVTEQPPVVPRWKERSNELTLKEMAAKVKVGSRVVRGRDWGEEWTYDGTPPGPGTVTTITDKYVYVKWDRGTAEYGFTMGPGEEFQLRLLVTNPLQPCLTTSGKTLDVSSESSKMDIKAMMSVSGRSDLSEVRGLVGLDCGPSPPWSHAFLRQVASSLEGLEMLSPEQRHLDVVLAMPQLKELCIIGVTGEQLRQVAQMASLRRLQVHCPFETPLPVQELPPTRLRWLRCGVYPLAAALAMMRASADTLEELQLVAASKEPYGCPDLAAELRRCGLKKLKKLWLLRHTGYGDFCHHDEVSCRVQKVKLWNMFLDHGIVVVIDCSECDKDEPRVRAVKLAPRLTIM